MTTTPNYSFQLPTVGGDQNSWGNELNANWSSLDTLLHNAASRAPGAYLPLTGGTLTGPLNSSSSLNIGGATILNGAVTIWGATTFQTTATFGVNPRVTSQGIIYTLSASNAHRQSWIAPSLYPYIDGTNASLGAYVFSSSDRRTKTDIQPSGDALDDLSKFNVVSFDRTLGPSDGRETSHHKFGLIANDVILHAPDCARVPHQPELFAHLELLPIMARCIKAIQQLNKRVAVVEAHGA